MERRSREPSNKMLMLARDFREPILSALEEVPVLGLLVKAYGIGDSVSDRIFVRKIQRFLDGFEEVGGPQAKAFAEEIHRDPELAECAAETVLLSINAITDLEKAPVLAYIYTAYLRDEIDLVTLRRLLNAVNQAMVDDLRALAHPLVDEAPRESDLWRANRSAILALRTTGLTAIEDSAFQVMGKRSLIGTEVTPLGKTLIEILRTVWDEWNAPEFDHP